MRNQGFAFRRAIAGVLVLSAVIGAVWVVGRTVLASASVESFRTEQKGGGDEVLYLPHIEPIELHPDADPNLAMRYYRMMSLLNFFAAPSDEEMILVPQ